MQALASWHAKRTQCSRKSENWKLMGSLIDIWVIGVATDAIHGLLHPQNHGHN
jgi:hypothetical protein